MSNLDEWQRRVAAGEVSKFSVHYKRPRRAGIHSLTVFAKDEAEASRKVKGWFVKGWQEYGITKHA